MYSLSVKGGTRKNKFLKANSVMSNLSVATKSNQFVGKKYRTSNFLKKQRNKRINSLCKFLMSLRSTEQQFLERLF